MVYIYCLYPTKIIGKSVLRKLVLLTKLTKCGKTSKCYIYSGFYHSANISLSSSDAFKGILWSFSSNLDLILAIPELL